MVPAKSFEDLVANGLDAFSNAAVKLEGWMPAAFTLPAPKVPLPDGEVLYFCVPPNDVLLGYWDTVADRLFKIRHCLNIEGVFQQLPLFAQGMLVQAQAARVDLSTALSDTQASLPGYRFGTLYQKAVDFNGDVRSLSAALLSALEKKDGEHLALLRSGHELSLLNATRDVRQRQVDEAQAQMDALNGSLAVAQARYDFYSSREFINVLEAAHLALTGQSAKFQEFAAFQESAAQSFA